MHNRVKFDDTGSLGYPSGWVVYHPSDSTLVTASRFLAETGEAELKLTTFSSLLLFNIYSSLFFLSSTPPPSRDITPQVLPAGVTP